MRFSALPISHRFRTGGGGQHNLELMPMGLAPAPHVGCLFSWNGLREHARARTGRVATALVPGPMRMEAPLGTATVRTGRADWATLAASRQGTAICNAATQQTALAIEAAGFWLITESAKMANAKRNVDRWRVSHVPVCTGRAEGRGNRQWSKRKMRRSGWEPDELTVGLVTVYPPVY